MEPMLFQENGKNILLQLQAYLLPFKKEDLHLDIL
jgi:hypothetical protein